MKAFISGGPTVNFSTTEDYVAFWEKCGKPGELVLNSASPGGVSPESRGFLWQGFLVRYSKPL